MNRKHTGKGKGKGKGKKGNFSSDTETRVYSPKEGEQLGVVMRILGGNHLECMCAEDANTTKRKVIRIPGKIRRRVWVRTGDLVVVEPWHDMSEQDKGDLIHRYRPVEITRLARNKRWLPILEVLQVEIPEQIGPDFQR